jgi:tellurite resistance protein
MELMIPPPEVAEAGLRGLKMVAMADGELHELERRLLNGAQEHILHTDFDLDALEPITPEELAQAVELPELRERILSAAIIMALIDGEATEAEGTLLAAYADAFGIDSQALADVQRIIDRHLLIARMDITRRAFIGQRGRAYVREQGIRGLVRALRAVVGIEDPKLAARYHALADYAPGTLGRSYHEFVARNGFSFPGEKDSAPEPILFHDCLHVLAEYDTDSLEETQIASFQAGILKKDPLFGMLFMLAQFHLGLQVTPTTGPEKLVADPGLMLEAFVRGTKVSRDLCVDWNPWDDFERPLEELRREFAIEPRRRPA